MLSTIPKYPYKSVILLDGDKKKQVQEINKINSEHQNLKFCESLDILQLAFKKINDGDKNHPLYCLKNKNIESYLDPVLKSKIPNYNKKIHGPKIAEEMENIPTEISDIFDILFE